MRPACENFTPHPSVSSDARHYAPPPPPPLQMCASLRGASADPPPPRRLLPSAPRRRCHRVDHRVDAPRRRARGRPRSPANKGAQVRGQQLRGQLRGPIHHVFESSKARTRIPRARSCTTEPVSASSPHAARSPRSSKCDGRMSPIALSRFLRAFGFIESSVCSSSFILARCASCATRGRDRSEIRARSERDETCARSTERSSGAHWLRPAERARQDREVLEPVTGVTAVTGITA